MDNCMSTPYSYVYQCIYVHFYNSPITCFSFVTLLHFYPFLSALVMTIVGELTKEKRQWVWRQCHPTFLFVTDFHDIQSQSDTLYSWYEWMQPQKWFRCVWTFRYILFGLWMLILHVYQCMCVGYVCACGCILY